MIGTLLNASTIVMGGAIGLATKRPLSAVTQARLKIGLGAFTVYIGLGTALSGFTGSFGHRAGQLLIAVLALMLGHLTGQLCRIQKGFNQLGRMAQAKVASAQSVGQRRGFNEGFVTCALLFCASPLAILGPLHEGLLGSFRVLAIKAVMDGLATMAFSRIFGWGVMLAAIPVLAWQGLITLLATAAEPSLRIPGLLDSFSMTGGLLVFSVALVILELKKIALADYLPSLIYAPVLTYLWGKI